MSGGWHRDFNLSQANNVTIELGFQLEQATKYDSDEFCEALCRVDGILIGATNKIDYVAQIVGDGSLGTTEANLFQSPDI